MKLRIVQILCFLFILFLGYISYQETLKEIERIQIYPNRIWDGI